MESKFWKIENCVPGRPSLQRHILEDSELNLTIIGVTDCKIEPLGYKSDKDSCDTEGANCTGSLKAKTIMEAASNDLTDISSRPAHDHLSLQSSTLELMIPSHVATAGSQTEISLHFSAADQCFDKEENSSGELNTVGTGTGKFLKNDQLSSKALEHDTKLCKFKAILQEVSVNLKELQQLSWSGITHNERPLIWKLLSNYVPLRLDRRRESIERKRLDYWNLVKQYIDVQDKANQEIYNQINIDVPRMRPSSALFEQKSIQNIFLRILFIWSIRHPASSYVQGMNDLVTPFFVVFLSEFFPSYGLKPSDSVDINSISKDHLNAIEADTFGCFSKFMEGIQDNYVFAQIGIQHKVEQLKDLIRKIDHSLHSHLLANGIDYLQFSFRWMNNLLTRELPLHCCVRLWDTFLAESSEFPTFLLYVYAAFLLHWREELLKEKDFQGLMRTLQNLPTSNWSESDVCVLMAEAYRLKFTFGYVLPNQCKNSNDI